MADAMIPLANLTLGSSQATVTFSSISGSYRDLIVIVANGAASNTMNLRCRLNGDTGSNYSHVNMRGAGSGTPTSTSSATSTFLELSQSVLLYTTTNYIATISFLDYSATDKHKTVLSRGNEASSYGTSAAATRWANTAAITSLVFGGFGGDNFLAGTSFALYGIVG